MYFNNVFIGFYVLIAFIGLIIGKFIAWCNIRIPENKKIFSENILSFQNIQYRLLLVRSYNLLKCLILNLG